MVQLYGKDEQLLVRNVVRFLSEGLNRGENAVVIATAAHNRLLTSGLEQEAPLHPGRLTCLDAHEALSRFMVNGKPEWDRFERTVGAVLQQVRGQGNPSGIRAYGEMVGVLWAEGNVAAAIELEGLWNRLLSSHQLALFCGYPIDLLDGSIAAADLNAVLYDHTDLVPNHTSGGMGDAVSGAMEDVLGMRALALRERIKLHYRPSYAEMPEGEKLVFWLKNNLPGQAAAILTKARGLFQPSPAASPTSR